MPVPASGEFPSQAIRPAEANFPPASALSGEHTIDAFGRAASSIARLDQALDGHPLRPAYLYRARLEAARRQAAVDGYVIDPWRLAAFHEGLRLHRLPGLSHLERGLSFDAARHAATVHRWLTHPEFDDEGEINAALAWLNLSHPGAHPLLAGAAGFHQWLSQGGARAPIRAAIIRYWLMRGLTSIPLPLTGAASLTAETPWRFHEWLPHFFVALAVEAETGLQQLYTLERAWHAARHAVARRRRNSRAALAVDILAATPLISPTRLAAALGMAVNNATAMLREFTDTGFVVEVSQRGRRRLFGLAALAPLRQASLPPLGPTPGRGPGRPRKQIMRPAPAEPEPAPHLPEPRLPPLQRIEYDYSELAKRTVEVELRIETSAALIARYSRQPNSTKAAPSPETDLDALDRP